MLYSIYDLRVSLKHLISEIMYIQTVILQIVIIINYYDYYSYFSIY